MKVPLTINDFLDRGVAVYPDRVAIVDEPDQPAAPLSSLTYAELDDVRRSMGVAMDELGIPMGARVAMVSHNSARLLTSLYGVSGNGRVFVPINFRLSRDEVAYIVEHSGAVALLIDPELADDLADIPCERVWIMGEESDAVWYGRAGEPAAWEPDEDATASINYTSGTTAKPKGIMHTTGGYLTGAATTHAQVFDIRTDTDVYWCAADIGWVTGHSYIVYGPLANHTTSVMYEGTPDFPDKDRLWEIIATYGVTIFYTAPTAIRAFMKWGGEYPASHDLSTLRLLGTVGEPINPEAWMWYHEHIGAPSCPVVDTWWQTETGGIMISPLPGVTATKPGSATHAIPGITAEVVDMDGNPVPRGSGGFLTIVKPWPSMLRSIYGDDKRYVDTYWTRYPGRYFPGDGAKLDEDGYIWVLGRVDDVMNVSGHRISTMEVESALVDHPAVAEAAVVGATDDLTGQAIAAFVTLRGGYEGSDELHDELRNHVGTKIGAIAKPRSIIFTPDLPKTRSGKIMRRLLRDISDHKDLGDVTTLANAEIVQAIADQAERQTSDDS